MRKILRIILTGSLLLLGGCADNAEKKASPSFMFWCFRQEIVSDDYHIPAMSTPAAATYLQQALKHLPGYVDSSYDLETRTLRINYKSSSSRKMNFEEAIAYGGFAVNNRPAYTKAKPPEGLK